MLLFTCKLFNKRPEVSRRTQGAKQYPNNNVQGEIIKMQGNSLVIGFPASNPRNVDWLRQKAFQMFKSFKKAGFSLHFSGACNLKIGPNSEFKDEEISVIQDLGLGFLFSDGSSPSLEQVQDILEER
jgi:hypothetical protein